MNLRQVEEQAVGYHDCGGFGVSAGSRPPGHDAVGADEYRGVFADAVDVAPGVAAQDVADDGGLGQGCALSRAFGAG